MSQNIKNLIGKLRFIDVFDAALLVAHDEWQTLPDSGGLSRADWTEERAANLVRELRGYSFSVQARKLSESFEDNR